MAIAYNSHPHVVDQQVDQQVSGAHIYTDDILILHGIVRHFPYTEWNFGQCQCALVYRLRIIRTAYLIVVLIYILDFFIEFQKALNGKFVFPYQLQCNNGLGLG
jgi:hypothetical protein